MRKRIRIPLAAALIMACHTPTRGCDLCTYSATIFGDVRDAAGDPVSGAPVQVDVGFEPCLAAEPDFDGARAVADGAGRYRVQVRSPVEEPPCVRVQTTAPGGTVVSAVASAVRFRLTAEASLPYDSIRVDLRLP